MTDARPETLLLIDGSSYFYRAYHAIRGLSNSQGMSTNAVFGVVRMLLKELKHIAPDYVAVVFDAKGKTFRHELYPQYKANRPPMPEDLQEQVEPLHAIVNALGLPLLSVDGVEADDVIGCLATRAAAQGMEVIISTGDKDLAQLVSSNITLVDTMQDKKLDVDGVTEKFGVPPDKIVDYLALVGDTSDNIPGIPKVGPKSAAKWLAEYGSVDELIANADKVKGKIGDNLRANLEQLKLARQLVTIKCDLDLDLDPKTLKPAAQDKETLAEWYRRLEFNSLLNEVLSEGDGANPGATQADRGTYELVLEEQQLQGWLRQLENAELIAFDTETTSIDSMQAELVGVSFAVAAGKAAYVPCAHDYPGAPSQIERQRLLQLLSPVLQSATPAKVGQHIKYDLNVLSRYGVQIEGIVHDTMLESYVLNSIDRHDLDSLALKHLGHKTIHFEEVAGKGAKQLTFNQVGLEQAGPYAAEDADITLQLHQSLWPQLEQCQSLRKVYEEIEIPLIEVLSQMERDGVLVDKDMLHEQGKELAKEIEALEQQAYGIAGEEFNLGSPKQIQAVLFEKLGLPVLKKTPKGQPSTAEEVLQELALDYPLPKIILEHRSFSKLKSTYIDRLPQQINPRTGRVHTSYHQAVTATGRLSSSNPNLQNIPVRTAQGRRIRQAFVAPQGKKIVAADYSQIELRIMAHLSADERLLQAFADGQDIHASTAAEVFGVELDKVSKEQRRSAKAINFGLIYGMSAFGLARQLGIERSQAQAYVDLYFQRYPGVKQFMDAIRAQAHDTGFVETVYGRRLYLPEINSKNAMRRQYAERTAINAPMQGTAADIIKRAMIVIAEWIARDKLAARMLMQVHDELVFEVEQSAVQEFIVGLNQRMCAAGADLSVPLAVETGVGDNWDQAH